VPPSLPTPSANAAATPRAAWLLQAARLNGHLLWIKLPGICGFMWLFFAAYFELLRNPAGPVAEMPLTALDRWIGFEPAALAAYLSLWVYVGIAPALMRNLRQLLAYGLWASALCATGLLLFYLFPTAVPATLMPDSAMQHTGFALIKGVDAPGNACPSMHVASAVFSAFWVAHHLRQVAAPRWAQGLNIGWCVLIVWSTMAVKQHVALDALAGTALALAFVVPSMRWFPHRSP
jgi:hypothetical protein